MGDWLFRQRGYFARLMEIILTAMMRRILVRLHCIAWTREARLMIIMRIATLDGDGDDDDDENDNNKFLHRIFFPATSTSNFGAKLIIWDCSSSIRVLQRWLLQMIFHQALLGTLPVWQRHMLLARPANIVDENNRFFKEGFYTDWGIFDRFPMTWFWIF